MSKRQLESIAASLAAQALAREAVESGRQQARDALLRESGRAYEHSVEHSASTGESARIQTILPWWEELVSSGLAGHLSAILRQDFSKRAPVSTTISSPSPDGRGYNVQLWIDVQQKKLRPVFTRFIPGATGFASGYKHKSLELVVDFAKPEGELKKIHPQVLVELARQIEAGIAEEELLGWLRQLR